MLNLLFLATSQTCENPIGQILNFNLVSNTDTMITGVFPEFNAVPAIKFSGWTAKIPGATWIWDKSTTTGYRKADFRLQFALPGVPKSGNLVVATDDNLLSATVNGNDSGCKGSSYKSGTEKNCNVLSYLVSGMNTIIFKVESTIGEAGLLYGLNISISI